MVRPTLLIRGLAPNQSHLSLVNGSILVEKSIKVVKTWLASKTAKQQDTKKVNHQKRAIALCIIYKKIRYHKYENGKKKKNEQIPKNQKQNTKIIPAHPRGPDYFPSNPVDDESHAPP